VVEGILVQARPSCKMFLATKAPCQMCCRPLTCGTLGEAVSVQRLFRSRGTSQRKAFVKGAALAFISATQTGQYLGGLRRRR